MTDRPLIPATAKTLKKVLDRRPILWIGAGASMAAGMPGTYALVDALVKEADDPIDPDNLTFEQVADAFVSSMGKGALADLLQRVLGGAYSPADLHRAIARCAADGRFAALVTTNYDDLLERALGDAGARFVHQSLEDNAVVVDPNADVRLLKLHGSRDDWQKVILSGRSYDEFGARYPFLEKQLTVLLRQHPVLFIGCSLQDRRILNWLKELGESRWQDLKPWRAVMTRGDWTAAANASELIRRLPILRPLVLDGYDQLGDLWSTACPAKDLDSNPKAYDVFLAYNSDDLPAVEILAKKLEAAGVKPFLASWHLIPGRPWQEGLEDALYDSRTCAVFVGSELGAWQNEEMRVALDQRTQDKGFHVIPVLLPGAKKPEGRGAPSFLQQLTWIEFPALDDEEAFSKLLWGING